MTDLTDDQLERLTSMPAMIDLANRIMNQIAGTPPEEGNVKSVSLGPLQWLIVLTALTMMVRTRHGSSAAQVFIMMSDVNPELRQ